VERFDPHRPGLGWQTIAPMNEARGRPGAAVDRLGRIYVIGGGNDGAALATVERFDPRDEQAGWSYVEPIPKELGLSQHISATTGADGRIYCTGEATQCLRYDPHEDSWAPWTSLPSPQIPGPSGLVTDDLGRILAIGGIDASPEPIATVQILSGPCGAERIVPLLFDIDGNHVIDIDEYTEVILNWGTCVP